MAQKKVTTNEYSVERYRNGGIHGASAKKLMKELPLLSKNKDLEKQQYAALRAEKVREMFKECVKRLYKENAPFVLEYINAAYILEDNGIKSLHIYINDASIRSDINTKQQLILLFLKEKYGEEVDEFKSYPSRFEMRKRKAYEKEQKEEQQAKLKAKAQLTSSEKEKIKEAVGRVENPGLRKALEKAMIADMKAKKLEKLSE
ncbi:MAG: hypothetical protein J6Y65_00525 [Eggerthellaceae bacterium]|nr:hypothetical protein [Eggerthellaceae bacterium]